MIENHLLLLCCVADKLSEMLGRKFKDVPSRPITQIGDNVFPVNVCTCVSKQIKKFKLSSYLEEN